MDQFEWNSEIVANVIGAKALGRKVYPLDQGLTVFKFGTPSGLVNWIETRNDSKTGVRQAVALAEALEGGGYSGCLLPKGISINGEGWLAMVVTSNRSDIRPYGIRKLMQLHKQSFPYGVI